MSQTEKGYRRKLPRCPGCDPDLPSQEEVDPMGPGPQKLQRMSSVFCQIGLITFTFLMFVLHDSSGKNENYTGCRITQCEISQVGFRWHDMPSAYAISDLIIFVIDLFHINNIRFSVGSQSGQMQGYITKWSCTWIQGCQFMEGCLTTAHISPFSFLSLELN